MTEAADKSSRRICGGNAPCLVSTCRREATEPESLSTVRVPAAAGQVEIYLCCENCPGDQRWFAVDSFAPRIPSALSIYFML